MDVFAHFADLRPQLLLESYFACAHDLLPALAAQALGRCAAAQEEAGVLRSLLDGLEGPSRRRLRPCLTAVFHGIARTTAPLVVERSAAALLRIALDADGAYGEQAAQLAVAVLARLALFDTQALFDGHLRPLAGLSATESQRSLTLRVLRFVFEDQPELLVDLDHVAFSAHANAILLAMLSPRAPPALQREAVEVLGLACRLQPRLALQALDLPPLLSRLAHAYVHRAAYGDDEGGLQRAMEERTALKTEALRLVRTLVEVSVGDAAEDGLAGEGDPPSFAPSLLHLLPDGPLAELYGAISARLRDAAPPPDSALRREALHRLQGRLGFADT